MADVAVVKNERVRNLHVPQYEGLEQQKICNFLAATDPEMKHYMPDTLTEIKKFPRGWCINVGATVVGKPFLDWIKQKILERNQKQAQAQNLLIKMDPQLAAAFQNSTHFSRKYRIIVIIADQKGSGAHMLKVESKRRRTKQQMDEDRQRAEQEQADVEEKLRQVA